MRHCNIAASRPPMAGRQWAIASAVRWPKAALRTVLEFVHAGDILMVTRIDRLARSIGDLQDIVRTVRARGAVLKATEQPIDTGTAAGKCFLDMFGVFAEFETNLRRERQLGRHR
jgi:DNA invertase Pin-like site-specific DNA recombinase